MEARHIAALEAAVLDLDAAATPENAGTFMTYGAGAADLRDAIKAALNTRSPVAEPVAWRVRAGLNHPLVEGTPFDWRLSEKRPEIGEGAKPEWFDIEPLYAAPPAPAHSAEKATEGQTLPAVCDGVEQEAFEAWARALRFDMHQHPLHYLFLDPQTDAARRGWRAGMEHVLERLPSRDQALDGGER